MGEIPISDFDGSDAPLPQITQDADWYESKHPRAKNGQFGEGNGASNRAKKLNKMPENGIININRNEYFPYLIDSNGNKLYITLSKIVVTSKMRNKLKKEGWVFDWLIPYNDGYEVHELRAWHIGVNGIKA